jgi:hypothetical protein
MRYMLILLLAAAVANATEVSWSRFKGKVKATNGKTSMVTIQNGEGDLIALKVDADVRVLRGKDDVKLGDLSIDDKVTLVYEPKAPAPKDDEPPVGGVYK